MIELKNINKKYDHTIFKDFNLTIQDDRITCILGESGVGKTTLLKMIAGLTDYSGTITGIKKIAYIFQEDRLIPSLTVYQNLKLVCPNASDEKIDEMLDKLKILDKKNTYPLKLSGGESKRVSIARAFLYDGEIILMDEAFSSLDLSLKLNLIDFFIGLWKQKPKTVLFVTHDVDEALLLGQEILILKNGALCHKMDLNVEYPRSLMNLDQPRKEIITKLTNPLRD